MDQMSKGVTMGLSIRDLMKTAPDEDIAPSSTSMGDGEHGCTSLYEDGGLANSTSIKPQPPGAVQIPLESMRIIEISQYLESILVLQHHIFVQHAMYRFEPIRGCIHRVCDSLKTI